jgi:tetratricopeptide (TPR) repeat protein
MVIECIWVTSTRIGRVTIQKMRLGYEIAVSAAGDSGLWVRSVNYLTAILCGLALLVAQYFVGRGPYPFLPLPAYAVLCLAGLSCAWQITRREFAVPRWVCISFAAALAAWIAIPLAGQSDLWLPAALLRLVLACWIVYGLLVFVITGTSERLALLSILLVGSFAQAALGIFQYLFPDAQPHLGWITDLCPERMEGHAFRARGFYYNANHLAWLLNFAGAFALSIGVWGRVSLWPRVLLLYGAAMFFGAGILTQSRGGLLGAGTALGVFLILSARSLMLGAWGSRGRMFGLVALAVLVTLGAAWRAYESSDLAQYRILKAGEETYRATVWKTAFRQWQSEPFFGTGLGTFTNFARQNRFRADALDDIFAHNDWVQSLAEIGLIGAGLGFCVLLVHLSSGWRSVVVDLRQRIAAGDSPVSLKAAMQMGAMSSLAAFAVHSFFDFNIQVPANALLVSVSLAILASSGRRVSSEPAPVFFSRLVFTSLLVAVLWLGWSAWKSLSVEFAWVRADAAMACGNSERALELAESGMLSNPKHSALAATGGRVALALGKDTRLSEVERRRLLQRSVELSSIATQGEPGDAWHLLNLAHAYDNLGKFEQSGPLHQAAIAKAPYYATPYEFYALHLELSASPTEAVRFYELALHLPASTFAAQRRDFILTLQK